MSDSALQIIALVAASRQEIILHTDGEPRIYDPDLDDERPPTGPSVEAKEKIEDHGELQGRNPAELPP
jgi:hypothetical protein